MATVLKVVNGRIEEYNNGSRTRTYGSNIVDADIDGQIVAAVTSQGRIEEYKNGSRTKSYGAGDAVRVKVSGDTIVVTTSKGRTEEYKNGSRTRSY